MDTDALVSDCAHRMQSAIDVLNRELGGLRTGRASANLLDPVMVNAYGGEVPLNQVANVSVSEARMLTVSVWDKSLVKAVERGILEAELGVNPQADGQSIRIAIPPLTEERRVELTKIAARYAEDTRVSIRNVRRHGIEELRKAVKDSSLSEDEQKAVTRRIETTTKDHTDKVDQILEKKNGEILQV